VCSSDLEWGDFHLNFVVQTVQSVRTHALCLRDAVRLWQLQTHQISMDELTETWEMKAIDEQPPADPDEALTVLADILNAGLRPFHAGLRVIAPNKDEVVGRHDITNVYSVMCLQLFNHIVENAVYMRCHNETCGRLFVRQRGRAKQPHDRGHVLLGLLRPGSGAERDQKAESGGPQDR